MSTIENAISMVTTEESYLEHNGIIFLTKVSLTFEEQQGEDGEEKETPRVSEKTPISNESSNGSSER